jgi:hypothetical protein
MKRVAIFVVTCVLLSYLPILSSGLCLSSVVKSDSSTDGCQEGSHKGSTGNTKMECCYAFHCPVICDGNQKEPLPLPLSGLLKQSPDLPKVDVLTHFIFHPPKNQIISISQG